jgi:hypothetical protein
MADHPHRRPGGLLPVLTLLLLALVLLAGWWLFPALQHYVAYQDCVASFRTNCS